MCLLEFSPQNLQALLFVMGLITGIMVYRMAIAAAKIIKQPIDYNGRNGAGYQPIDNGKKLRNPPKFDRYGRCMDAVQKAKANFEPSALPPSPPKAPLPPLKKPKK